MHVDDVVEAIFQALCARQRASGLGATLNLVELRLACGVTSDELAETLDILQLTAESEPRIRFTDRDHVTLDALWVARCGDKDVTSLGGRLGE